MRRFFLITILFLVYNNIVAQSKTEILKVMQVQQDLWNKGDIPGFMEYYWKNDSLKFIGKNGVNYGWQTTLNNYKKNYPNKATMGTLKFDILNVDFHSKSTAWVLGKWFLLRPDVGDVGGYFTLIFRKINGKWLIVIDHTS